LAKFKNCQNQNDGFFEGRGTLDKGEYGGKVLRIDLSKGSHRVERVEEVVFEKYLGINDIPWS
jgi:hypothetical protein